MGFERGEQVEVVMEDEGFKGSYYPAIIISKKGTSRYKVEYTTLLKDDESGPLEAVIDVDQLRPVPPPMPVMDFDLYDLADAYEHDGWWGGIIYKKFELDYLVYFPTLGKALAYPSEKLRIHQEWANGRWTCTKSANKSFEEKQAKKSPKGKQVKKNNVSLPKPTVVEFQTGQKMGMIEEEEGFESTYNSANIISIEGPVDIEEKTGQLSKKKQAKRSSKGKQAKKKNIGLPKPTVMEFQTGQELEVIKVEEGFEGPVDIEGKTGQISEEKQVKMSFRGKQAKKKNIGLPKPTVMEFQTGQELEVIKVEEGFEGPVDIEGKTGQISKKKQAKMSFRGKQAKKKNIGLPKPTAVEFQTGQELEVMIEKEGFEGSYNAANLKSSEGPSQYPLEYKTLWKESKSGPLVEVEGDDQLLLPPHVLANKSVKEKQPKIEYEGQTGNIIQKKLAKMNSKGKRVQIEFEEETGKIFQKKPAKSGFKGKRANKKKLSLPEPKVIEFQAGDEVEVMLKEEGFEGSYYAAKIISKEGASQYKVEYKTLLKEDDSGPLEEVVGVHHLRPSPPPFPVSYFSLYELADVYESDGWWAGIINGKFQSDYFLYFPTTQEEIPYRFEQLRVHQDWSDGQWISSKEATDHIISISEPEGNTKQKRTRKIKNKA